MIHYTFTKELNLSYEAVVEKVIEALKGEGFGTLTEIDGKAKLKEKLGVDSRKYLILGACNPRNAFMSQAKEKYRFDIPLQCDRLREGEQNSHICPETNACHGDDR